MPKRLANCRCPGAWYDKVAQWRLLLARPGMTSRVKCMRCGWKWWTRRKYADRLPVHKERSRVGMTDADILGRIEDGTLLVLLDQAVVVSVSGGRRRALRQTVRTSPNGGSYRFVTVCHRSKKKKIAVHRLVWMAHTRALIPDGYDVHHVRGQRAYAVDGIANLSLLPSEVNCRIQEF